MGQLAPPNPPAACVSGPGEVIQAALSSGTPYTVPTGYTVLTSWSTNAAAGLGQTLKLKVFRKIAEPSTYLVVGHDGPRALLPSTLNTFQTSIPVQAGDTIGLNDQNASAVNNACLFETGNIADVFAAANSDLGDGGSANIPPASGGYKLNLTAVLDRPATVASIVPASGSIKGGTTVTITGQDFSSATSVTVGSQAATGIVVNSDTQVTATVPASTTKGPVDVSIVNAAGQSTAAPAARFTYQACVVPKLRGKKIKSARTRLRRAECKLGKVKGKKGGRVVSQRPKPGKVKLPGAKVNVGLG